METPAEVSPEHLGRLHAARPHAEPTPPIPCHPTDFQGRFHLNRTNHVQLRPVSPHHPEIQGRQQRCRRLQHQVAGLPHRRQGEQTRQARVTTFLTNDFNRWGTRAFTLSTIEYPITLSITGNFLQLYSCIHQPSPSGSKTSAVVLLKNAVV